MPRCFVDTIECFHLRLTNTTAIKIITTPAALAIVTKVKFKPAGDVGDVVDPPVVVVVVVSVVVVVVVVEDGSEIVMDSVNEPILLQYAV
ncbi:MAG: hypothetical protein ACXACG_04085, partial [Candidatus Thorarchaeota archaeon]